VADLEALAGVRPSYFEAVTAAAFRWFSDVAVDVAVVEVGLLGRWDATNVVTAQVAVVTNIGLDHMDLAGPTLQHIAREKAGIIKPTSVVVLGETRPELDSIFVEAGGVALYRRGRDFGCTSNDLALGGRLLDLKTPLAAYPEVFLSLNGAHQGDNAAVAVTAAEAFFDAPLDPEIVAAALGAMKMPGRFEVLGYQPLVIVDGAHNPAGADVCATALEDDFEPAGDRIYVLGFLRGHGNPADMLNAFGADQARLVVCCTPPSERGIPADEVLAIAQSLGCEAVAYDDVVKACDRALDEAGSDDAILVAGSLYVVGAARPHLLQRLAR
jgi:dihydrofolate synthase/folylpolyglutamate synthase